MLEKIKNKKILLTMVGILIVFLMIILEVINNKNVVVENTIMDQNQEVVKKEANELSELITVDIKGSVINPGVYSLKKDSRVIDIVRLAGGYSEDADTSLINLSKKLKDEMVIIIYNKEIVAKILNDNENKSPIAQLILKPNDINEATIDKNNTNIPNNSDNVNDEQINGKVNINTASIEELMMLSGIGEAKAKSIIDYRKNSPFTTIEDIKNVTGIGEAVFEKIKENICV